MSRGGEGGVRVSAMPNAHSHAFQRGLRGRAERPAPAAAGADDFWSWREAMDALAADLEPDSIERAALECYREMAGAGYGAVGEFHYVHHRPDGSPYEDPNAMAKALALAGRAAGSVVVLLPAAYARAGPGRPPESRQLRFCDPSVEAFLARVEELRTWAEGQPGVSVGVAAHSARAVPANWLEAIGAFSDEHGLVRHVHAAEQPRESEEVRAEHGCSPIELLERKGFLGPLASVVHAIHVTERDVELLAASGSAVVSCPTTEGNLGDGHPPLLAFRDAGVPIAMGSDSQVRIDPFEEARELETLARREGLTRHALLAASGDLWAELCNAGARSLGIESAGEIEIDTEHADLRGIDPDDLPLALATCASAAVVRAAPP
ncbi:MAG: formimidoylglutamate deiminase [Thermoleophilaceae bacterium]